MRHIPKAYERYRHFKGNCYQILAIAKHAEDATEQVVYQALYPPFTIYVRPLSMFMSEVDREKYPSATQHYRFELVSDEEPVPEARAGGAGPALKTETLGNTAGGENGSITAAVTGRAAAETDEAVTAQAAHEWTTPETAQGQAEEEVGAEWAIDEDVLAFLDADTYEQKLNIFSAMHNKVTQDMLNTIAAALDIEVDSGDLEERYRQIQNCLMTFQKYECNRLR
ncbi:MAG: DUF1653 domain-containing protein [Lachnospiraceae bacterium]|nr:DUF1653 domain-containing protein [Lachnospiraceae bacterium]MDE7238161.1 DUF1653 domain-containing protein [Lachnospiraceae bacterium]